MGKPHLTLQPYPLHDSLKRTLPHCKPFPYIAYFGRHRSWLGGLFGPEVLIAILSLVYMSHFPIPNGGMLLWHVVWHAVWQPNRMPETRSVKDTFLSNACQFVLCYVSIKEDVSSRSQDQATRKERHGQIQWLRKVRGYIQDNSRKWKKTRYNKPIGESGSRIRTGNTSSLCCPSPFTCRSQVSLINQSCIR